MKANTPISLRSNASPLWRLLMLLLAAALLSGAGLVGCDKDEETEEEASANEEGEGEATGEDPEGDEDPEASADEPGDDDGSEMVIAEPGDFEMDDPAVGDPSDDPVVPPTAAEEAQGKGPKPGRQNGATDAPGDRVIPKRVVEVERNFLKVAAMLDPKDVWKALDYKGLLEVGEFVGQPPSKTYNATRLAGDDDGFGVALQVWKPGSAAAATTHFDQLYKNSLGGSRTKDVGDLSFRVENHGLRSVVFLDKRRSAVAWLTCDKGMCEFEGLAELARRVQRKL